MSRKRHEEFWLEAKENWTVEAEKKWTEKVLQSVTSNDDDNRHWVSYKNPNLTLELIESHPEPEWSASEIWSAIGIAEAKNKELFIIDEARKYMAVYKIKNWWKEIYYSPNTKIGKRRLEKSYGALFE